MSDYSNHAVIKDLLKSERGELSDMNPELLQVQAAQTFSAIIEKLDYLYDLLFLEGLVRNDHFHAEKKELIKQQIRYGYITSTVTRTGGTNTYRFMYRRPLAQPNQAGRTFSNESIRMTKHGYGKEQFKHTASYEELSLCMNTEAHYARLREQGTVINKIRRSLVPYIDLNQLYGVKRLEAKRMEAIRRKSERESSDETES